MRFYKFIISTTLFVLFLSACGINAASDDMTDRMDRENVDTTKIETFEVADTLAYCEQMVPRKCLQVKREKSKNFVPLYDEIENFKFIHGFKYILKVEVAQLRVTPKDTSGYKYYLKEVVKREKVEKRDKYANLYLSKWLLTKIDGKDVDKNRGFLVVVKHKQSFYGNGGCNSIGGQFSPEDKSFSAIRQTRRMCANSQTIETPFLSNLQAIDRIEVEIDRLSMYKNGNVVLEFKSNWEN